MLCKDQLHTFSLIFSSSRSKHASTWSSTSPTTSLKSGSTTSKVSTSQETSMTSSITTSESPTTSGVPAPIRCPEGSYNEFGTLGSGPKGNCESAMDCMGVGPASNMSLRLEWVIREIQRIQKARGILELWVVFSSVSCHFNLDESASRCCYSKFSSESPRISVFQTTLRLSAASASPCSLQNRVNHQMTVTYAWTWRMRGGVMRGRRCVVEVGTLEL